MGKHIKRCLPKKLFKILVLGDKGVGKSGNLNYLLYFYYVYILFLTL